MAQKIVIKTESNVFEAELNDSMTGKAIYDALPIRAKAQRWGGEIYFNIPVSCELEEDSREGIGTSSCRQRLNKKPT